MQRMDIERLTQPFYFTQIVKLQFLSFDVEYHKNCDNDVVKVYDGSDTRAPRLGSFCGSALPGDIVSADNTVYVSFVPSVQSNGFEIKYTTVDSGKNTLENSRLRRDNIWTSSPSMRNATK